MFVFGVCMCLFFVLCVLFVCGIKHVFLCLDVYGVCMCLLFVFDFVCV